MINLTNPSSIVQYAINYATRVKVVSICDLPMMAAQTVADLLELPVHELVVRYAGMNHFGWVTGVHWQGQDMMPKVLDKIATLLGLPVETDIIRALGVIPTSYFKYFYHANRVLAAQQGNVPAPTNCLNWKLKFWRSTAPKVRIKNRPVSSSGMLSGTST